MNMSQNLPHINIIIANYNYANWLTNAIDSAMNQTYPNISITIIDDYSTDDSWAKIHKTYFQPNPHERVYPSEHDIKKVKLGRANGDVLLTAIRLNKNSGPSKARNVGFDNAPENTHAFVILDADDEMNPNKVDRMLVELISNRYIGVVYADYDIFNLEQNYCIREYKQTFSVQELLNSCIVHSAAMISKEALTFAKDQYGYYDERIKGPEDYDLWLRIARKYMIIHIPESLSKVRVTGKNISGQSHPEFNENYRNGFEIIRSKNRTQ